MLIPDMLPILFEYRHYPHRKCPTSFIPLDKEANQYIYIQAIQPFVQICPFEQRDATTQVMTENPPVQSSKQGCTYAIMVEMLSST